jgi:uncharacterized Zn finger protein (UPF0148 family)
MNKEKCVVTNCCVCGLPFRALGDGNFVACPYCGAELSFTLVKNNRYSQRKEPQYDPELDNPLYYDEDLEGAPGYYGGD